MSHKTCSNFDINESLEVVWEALNGFRENCISEGDTANDSQWDEITTAMAWITEATISEDISLEEKPSSVEKLVVEDIAPEVKPLTVEKLADIADSQNIVHGNHKLFVLGEFDEPISFELYVGECSVLECISFEESCIAEHGLESLLGRLEGLDDSVEILASHSTPLDKGFRVGIKSDEGFVEILNSEELVKPTIVK